MCWKFLLRELKLVAQSLSKKLLFIALSIAKERLERHPEFISRGFIHFSFIVYNKKIISIGHNRCGKNPPQYGYENHSKIHSEVDAWRKARGLLKGDSFDVINIRLNRFGKFKNSRPCKNCIYLLQELGCKNFYYTTNLLGQFNTIKRTR